MPARKLVLLGWDAADWKIINPLIDAGMMPNFQRLVETGVSGNIRTMSPVLSPILWNSIATGKPGDEHGILGFLEPDPVTGGVRSSASTTRKVKAIWNILDENGFTPHVINWLGSHPAEKIRGIAASSLWVGSAQKGDLLAPAGSIHPPEAIPDLEALMVGMRDLTGDDLALFIPRINEVDQEKDKSVALLAALLAGAITTHAATTWILEHRPWDFVGAYFDLIDRAGHIFMPFHPPRAEGIDEHRFELYKDVVTGLYRFHDLMLGRVMQLAGPDATIMVVSDHGFFADHRRPVANTDPEAWHREHGVICIAGPGLRRDELVHGAGLLDVTPTVLTLFGLPVANDMKGRALAEIFETAPALERIPTWENGDGAIAAVEDSWDSAAAIEQLVALGYVEAPSEDTQKAAAQVRDGQTYNLVRIRQSQGKHEEAIPLLEELIEKGVHADDCRLRLALAHLRAGRSADCLRIAAELLSSSEERPLPRLLQAEVAMNEGRSEEALRLLQEAHATPAALQGTLPYLDARMGRAYLKLKRWIDAEMSFRAALDENPEFARAHRGLAIALLEQDRPKEAAEAALEAVGLDYPNAYGHWLLGVSLSRIGVNERAEQAFVAARKLGMASAAAPVQ
ncbi:MAG: alkaline phosphatase family protein [Bryobacteraceae bacterium]